MSESRSRCLDASASKLRRFCFAAGHNGGPPLDEQHVPEWGEGGIGNYFYWKAAHRRGLA